MCNLLFKLKVTPSAIAHIAIGLSLLLSINIHAKVIHQERSLYRNILVEEQGDLRCLKFNVRSSKTRQSCMYISEPNRLVFDYTKRLFTSLLAFSSEAPPQKILIIGLGGGSMSNALHNLYPEAFIENVEIDPAVIKVAREYFDLIENEYVSVKENDGRLFVKRAILKQKKFDLIILDAFNGDYIPEHLMTQEFLLEIKQLLTNEGVLAANTFSVSKLYNYESATYKSVWGDFYQVQEGTNSNRIILTRKKPFPPYSQMSAKAKTIKHKLIKFDIDILKMAQIMTYTKDHQNWPINTDILTDQYSPANLLNAP